jgi:hypothetical protein
VSLFKRKRRADQPQDGDDLAQDRDATELEHELEERDAAVGGDAPDAVRGEVDTPVGGIPVVASPPDRSGGPFDVSEVDGPGDRLDVGALWLPLTEGLEVQLQVDEASGQVTGVFLVHGNSAVQIQAFAAPRTEGIWNEIADEIAAGITEQGGTVDPGQGRFGRELLARVPAQQPDGTVGFQPLRFTGVDGPRWLLRAVYHGEAAIDPDAAAPLEQLVSQVVVVRGREPMGPRELLPLRLPEGAQPAPGEVLEPEEAGGEVPEGYVPEGYDDLHPFERGPEITERR